MCRGLLSGHPVSKSLRQGCAPDALCLLKGLQPCVEVIVWQETSTCLHLVHARFGAAPHPARAPRLLPSIYQTLRDPRDHGRDPHSERVGRLPGAHRHSKNVTKSVGSRVNADKILYVSLAVSPRSASLEVSLQEHATVPSTVRIGGRVLRLTPVFETYWRFAAERQATYLRKQYGLPSPWTKDPVIAAHRFTNCYRATDRVSQFLINHVIYEGVQKPEEVVFRTLLFKFFNKIPTWQWLQRRLGELTWRDFDADQYGHVLGELAAAGEALYSAAYVMPSPRFGHARKFRNHLALLEHMMRSGVTRRLQDATSMAQAFEVLRGYRGLGDFLAFQYLIDINYSEVLGFDEMEYVVAGPGARSGIRKAFGPASMGLEREIIAFMADQQENFFSALGLSFGWLKGRPLQLIDCQNLFCEVDKYARVAHPEVSGGTGRHRIKQRYAADSAPMEAAALPPKWHTEVPKLDIIV